MTLQFCRVFCMYTDFKILPPTIILAPLVCFSKKRLFEELGESAGAVLERSTYDIIKALNEREWAGSTVIADGVAIPHAKVDGTLPALAILCMMDKKIPFNTIDSDPVVVDIAFSFYFSPDANIEELQLMLAHLAEIFDSSDLRASLRRSHHDESKLIQILHKIDYLLLRKLKLEEDLTTAEETPDPEAAAAAEEADDGKN